MSNFFLWYGFHSSIRAQRIKTGREAVLRHFFFCRKLALVEYLYVSHLCVFKKNKKKKMHIFELFVHSLEHQGGFHNLIDSSWIFYIEFMKLLY